LAEQSYRPINDECLGQLRENYCKYCSQECPWTHVCVLIAVSNYLLQEQIVLPPQDSIHTL